MANVKITRTVDGAGAVSYAEVEMTLTDEVVAAAAAPLKIMESDASEYLPPRVSALAAFGYGSFCIFAGDKWGESIPVLGGHRV
jgi:hypothetical protein